jgi:exportin-T
VRSRAFYLLHRFIKELRNDISPDLANMLLTQIADTLVVDSTLPTDETEVSSDAGFTEIVTELATHSTSFDSQAYMFEAAGTLLSLLWRTSDAQQALFRGLIAPILQEMQMEIQAGNQTTTPDPRDANAILAVVKLQRNIISLGQIAKGFPDYPPTPPPGYILPPIPIFQQCVEAIMISLDAMSRYKIIREAVRIPF